MGYGDAPWIFTGRALYQLHLVRVEEARKYVPPEFRLVSLFGYTLGGFYLARYDDSPVGAFDELVAMAGLVWNAPTSCAWAARVYVSNRAARDHGRGAVGLPSRVAAFDACGATPPSPSWWDPSGAAPPTVHLVNDERARSWRAPLRGRPCGRAGLPGGRVATLHLPPPPAGHPGPRLAIALPSFSGATPDCPALLKYACQLATRVRPVAPARVVPRRVMTKGAAGDDASADDDHHAESLAALLGGRPLLALQFGDMRMVVNEPERVVVGGGGGEASGWRARGARRAAPALLV